MTPIKILGLLLILTATTLFGFYKSNSLIIRSKKLGKITHSLGKLAQLVRCGSGELENVLLYSFSSDILTYKNGEVKIFNQYLLKEDLKIFDNFFLEIGMNDRESEYKKIMLYKALFEKQLKAAEDNVSRLSKLYNSLGFLTGVSICIFLI